MVSLEWFTYFISERVLEANVKTVLFLLTSEHLLLGFYRTTTRMIYLILHPNQQLSLAER